MPKAWHLLLAGCSLGFCALTYADARLAIIIDDIGYNQSQSERAARLQGDFTLSILPFTPHGLTSAQLAHKHGKELMLHLPMSAINNLPLGNGGLVSGMEKAVFLKTFQQDMDNIPHIQGVNNHMGSRLTQETEPMQWLMEELRPRGLYFVDSRTSAQTKAFDIAITHQIPSLKRDVFLDDINETAAIELQLNRALKFARQRGSAVAIGHPYPATLGVLERLQGFLDKQQVKLVYVSQLLTSVQTITTPAVETAPLETGELPYCPVPAEPSLFEFHTIIVD